MSKGLEVLKEIKQIETNGIDMGKFTMVKIGSCPNYWELFDTVEKELKALEIIRNKEVDVYYIKHFSNYKTYSEHTFTENKLTKEEYELLKEILNDK